MSSPTQPPNQSNFYAESRRIIAANTGHFLALAFIFFIPLWFSIISFPFFLQTKILSQNNLNSFTTITLSSLYALLVFSLSATGIATITYSTNQGFHRTPLNLLTTIKSLFRSFFPLAYTILASLLCLILICIGPVLYAGLLIYAIKILGCKIDYGSYYFIGFCAFAFIIEFIVLIFCQVCCVLTGTISVVESKWGFEPLRQSYYLIRGIKSGSVFLFFLYWIIIWVLVVGLSYHILVFGQRERSSLDVYLDVLQTAALSIPALLIMVQFVAATTVLYLCWKDSVVELGLETSNEYVSLAMDDENLVHESNVNASTRILT